MELSVDNIRGRELEITPCKWNGCYMPGKSEKILLTIVKKENLKKHTSMQSKQYVTRTCEKGEICDAMIQ